jgi:hypothetical protein
MNGLGNAETIEANRRRIADAHGVRVLHHGADLSKPAETAAQNITCSAICPGSSPTSWRRRSCRATRR